MSKKSVISYMTAAMCSFFAVSCAYADTGSLSFSGSVSTTCAFSNITPGTLAVDPTSPTIIGTNVAGGSNAGVTLTYLGNPTMSVEEIGVFTTKPNGVSNGDFTYTTNVSSQQGASYTSSGGYKTHTYTTGSSDNLSVIFNASKSSGNVTLGNYATSAVITCQ